MNQDAAFQKRLLATFAVEAQEHLKGITSGLIELEQEGAPQRQEEIVEKVFREAHSLKGAARTVNLGDVEGLCQAMEGLFAAMKRKEVVPSPMLFDLLQRALDILDQLLRAQRGEGGSQDAASRRGIIAELAQAVKEGTVESREAGQGEEVAGEDVPEEEVAGVEVAEVGGNAPAAVPHPPALEETVRVSTAKLNSLLLLSEEMVSAKLSASQHATQMRQIRSAFGVWKKEWGRIVPDLPRGGLPVGSTGVAGGWELGEDSRVAARIQEFLQWNASFMNSLAESCDAQVTAAVRDSRSLGGMVDNLLDEVKTVRCSPFPPSWKPSPRSSGISPGTTARRWTW